jgi:hypothetical protein
MIITGRTINQLPTLSAITSASTLILQTGNTTFKANLSEFAKSSVFGSIYQDLIPVSSNTFSIGTTGSTIKSLYVTSGSVIVGKSGLIGIDSSGNTYSTSGISTPSLFIGNVTSDGIKSTGITINIVSGYTLIINQSGQSINLFKQIVPTGGTTNQVLAKNNSNDYDYSWQNLQGLYITGATSNGGGLNIYQSATTSTLAFKTITSLTPTHITITDTGGLLKISGTGLLTITNNGAGAFVAQSGTSSSVSLRSLSSQTPSNLIINASGDLITFSAKTFITGATNNGSGTQVYQSGDTQTLSFRTLSSSTSDNLTISTSGALVLFSGKTFITGATNLGNGSVIFKSGDTQTLSFRSLSSSTPNNITITTSGDLILFSATTTLQQAYNNSSQPEILTDSTRNALTIRNGSGANTLNIFEGQNSGSTITSFIRADGTISGSTFLGDGSQLSRYYGSFYSTSAMTAANTTTAYVMSANTTGVNSGVILSSGSRIVMQSAGTYDIKYSAQLIKTSGSPSSSTVSIWLRKNGTDIQNTNAEFDITKLTANNGKTVASFNYIDTFTAGQYVEFVWSTTSTDVTVGNIGAQANPTRPTTPSLYVSVSQV